MQVVTPGAPELGPMPYVMVGDEAFSLEDLSHATLYPMTSQPGKEANLQLPSIASTQNC